MYTVYTCALPDEHSEGFRIEDVDVFVLSSYYEAADGVLFFVALLQCCYASDDRLTLQGNVFEHHCKWHQVLRVQLKKPGHPISVVCVCVCVCVCEKTMSVEISFKCNKKSTLFTSVI